jgi:hypothetical protein
MVEDEKLDVQISSSFFISGSNLHSTDKVLARL